MDHTTTIIIELVIVELKTTVSPFAKIKHGEKSLDQLLHQIEEEAISWVLAGAKKIKNLGVYQYHE